MRFLLKSSFHRQLRPHRNHKQQQPTPSCCKRPSRCKQPGVPLSSSQLPPRTYDGLFASPHSRSLQLSLLRAGLDGESLRTVQPCRSGSGGYELQVISTLRGWFWWWCSLVGTDFRWVQPCRVGVKLCLCKSAGLMFKAQYFTWRQLACFQIH